MYDPAIAETPTYIVYELHLRTTYGRCHGHKDHQFQLGLTRDAGVLSSLASCEGPDSEYTPRSLPKSPPR